MSGEVRLRGIAPELDNSEESSQRKRFVATQCPLWPARVRSPDSPTDGDVSNPVVLKLGTAVSLGSAKQFQGDCKEVADFSSNYTACGRDDLFLLFT